MIFKLGPPHPRRGVLRLGAAAMLSWLTLPSAALEKENSQMSSEELEQRGKRLREEVEQEWKKLKDSKSLRPRNDITGIFSKYIPIGTSFDHAKAILQSAGLSPRFVEKNKPRLVGTMDLLDNKSAFSKVEVVVALYPQLTGDLNGNIGEIGAVILYTSL